MVEKVVRDGQVAVLFSPGFGAGWSTWNSGEIAKRMLFDPALVAAVEAGDRNKAAELAEQFDDSEEPYVCVLGAEGLRIQWLPMGTPFQVDEYDGAESISVRDQEDWIVA